MRVALLLTVCIGSWRHHARRAGTGRLADDRCSRARDRRAERTGDGSHPGGLFDQRGQQIREVTSVEPATAPLHVAVIVDDNGTGIFRFGVEPVRAARAGRAEMSLRVVNGQVRTITEFTSDADLDCRTLPTRRAPGESGWRSAARRHC